MNMPSKDDVIDAAANEIIKRSLKRVLFWILCAFLLGVATGYCSRPAHADMLRVDGGGQRIKYAGVVTEIDEPTLTSPARLSFVQGGLPIGGGPIGKPPPGAVPFVLEFTDRAGVVHELACVAPPPGFDGVEFHAHFACEAQP